MLIGGFISGLISGRLGIKIDKGPRITNITRLIFAFAGGLLFAFGAQFARGCTSGAALSGMGVLATGRIQLPLSNPYRNGIWIYSGASGLF